MSELIGPVEPWAGLLDALGVLVVLGVWYAVRDAGDRTRAVAAAAGAAFFALAVSRAANRINAFVAWNNAFAQGGHRSDGRSVAYALLGVAGIAAGALAVARAHRAAANAAEDLADDALVPGDDDEPDGYTVRRRRLVAFAPWLDLVALSVALALPVLLFGHAPALGGPGGINGWLALFHVVDGVLLAGPLLLVARHDALPDARPVVAAFGVVAAGAVLRALAPDAFANEWWSSVASGLAVGLLAAAGFMLVARALAADRAAVTAGVLAAVAVGVLASIVVGQVFAETFPPQVGPDGVFGDFPGEIEGEIPDLFTEPPG